MKNLMFAGLAIVFSLCSGVAVAGEMTPTQKPGSGLTVENAWSRATVPGARAAAIYMTVVNHANVPATIEAMSTEVAKMTEAHQTISDGGMMRMRPAERLTIAPGESLAFEPGGLHVMLMGLDRQLSEGDRFLMRIATTAGQQVETQVLVGRPDQLHMPR